MVYDSTYKAYALGFHAGYHDGFWEDHPFKRKSFTEKEYHAAKAGFDAGVTFYCEELYGEES